MDNTPAFFGGDGSDLGHVRRLSPTSFRDLVDQVLNVAVTLNVTREQYALMDHKDRQRAKRVPYVVPCTFAGSPSRRVHEEARTITLICLDIDDPQLAAPYYSSPETVAEQLMPFNFALYTTASSTPEAPKLRVLVEASHLPLSRYKEAVRDIAGRIGLIRITKESFTEVQPMYLPTLFKADPHPHPLLIAETGSRAYGVRDILQTAEGADPEDPAPAKGGDDGASADDLDFLRPTVAEITLGDAAAALKHVDPDCAYPEWLEIAAALRHQFPGDASEPAFTLFDEWSSAGSKYVGVEDTRAKWDSLRPNPRGRVPVTIRSLVTRATANGWDSSPLKAKCYATTLAWIRSHRDDDGLKRDGRISEVISEGLKRIVATPLLSTSEEEALLAQLLRLCAKADFKVGLPTLRKDLRRLKALITEAKAKKARLPDWCKGTCYVSKLNQFLRHSTGEYFSPEALDRVYGSELLPSEEQLKETGDQSMGAKGKPILRPQDYLLNIVGIPCAYDTLYDPQQLNDTFIHREGKVYVNTFVRNYPEPDTIRASEAGELFLGHLSNLIAEEDHRRTVLDFLAYMVQYPGRKIRWAILLQGAQGCGKTLLAEAMKAVLGRGHVIPIDNDALRGTWNEWAYGCQLVTLEEIRVAGMNRHEVMNKLKPLISNDLICVNQRFRDSRTLENKVNYLLFTNHHDALALSDGDRRYFVLKSALQTKDQVLALGQDYFTRLFSMIEHNAAGLRAFLEAHEISEDFNPNGHAPVTRYLDQLVQDTATDATATVREILEDAAHPLLRGPILSATLLHAELALAGAEIAPQHLAWILRENGWERIGRHILRDRQKHRLWIRPGLNLTTRLILAQADQALEEGELL